MFKHILIPTDGSELSQKAARQAIELAKANRAHITALTVSAPFHILSTEPVMVTDTEEVYENYCKEKGSGYLNTIAELAKNNELDCQKVHVFAEHPYEEIIRTANKMGCDLICMASHGYKGMQALILGSETTKVLTHSKTPVLVLR